MRSEVDEVTNPKEPRFADAAVDELNANFLDAIARLYRRLRAERSDDEISDSQRSVLKLLVSEGPRTLSELSDHEHMKPPSMSETVRALEQSGLVVRTSDPSDGRKVILVASAEGTALIVEARRRRHEWLNQRLVELSEEERRLLTRASQVIVRITDS